MKIIITVEFDENDQAIVKDTHGHDGDDRMDISPHAKFFDAGCRAWTDDFEENMCFLRQTQIYCNQLLTLRGQLLLNDVYDMLGMCRTKHGQRVGWVYNEKNPVGDNYVDFGLGDINRLRAYFDDYGCMLLDFNVDGYILDEI